MESIDLGSGGPYATREASIHLARYLPVKDLVRGRKVLDIACGPGYGSHLMANDWGAGSVTGVDIDADAIARAKKRYRHSALSYVESDAGAFLESGKQKFDLIVSIETIEHLDDPDAFLLAAKRRLSKNGLLFVTAPNDRLYFASDFSLNPYHRRVFSQASFRKDIENLGFKHVLFGHGTVLDGFLNVVEEKGNRSPRSIAGAIGGREPMDIDRLSEIGGKVDPIAAVYYFSLASNTPLDAEHLNTGVGFGTGADVPRPLIGARSENYRPGKHRVLLLASEENARDSALAGRLAEDPFPGIEIETRVVAARVDDIVTAVSETDCMQVHVLTPSLAVLIVKALIQSKQEAVSALADKWLSVSALRRLSKSFVRTTLREVFDAAWLEQLSADHGSNHSVRALLSTLKKRDIATKVQLRKALSRFIRSYR